MSYGNGIKLTTGFDVGAKSPLDNKSVVETIDERDAFVTDNLAYEGLEVYVKETKIKYRYNGTEWINTNGGTGGSVDGYTKGEVNTLLNKKLDKPETDGTKGQVLTVQADGTNAYADVPQYDDAEIKEVLNKKLAKPEIEGTVGQVLTVQEDGTNAYADVPQYDDTKIQEAMANKLDKPVVDGTAGQILVLQDDDSLAYADNVSEYDDTEVRE